MDKETLGAFLAENRRTAGLTQREIASRLHVTDKAVSKWERGLSYPDVTLLEPLAAALGLGVEELVACRRQAERREDASMKQLLEISGDSVRRERRKGRWKLAAAAVLFAFTAAVLWYASRFETEQQTGAVILRETVDGRDYLYWEQEGRLLRLDYTGAISFQPARNRYYTLTFRWDRKTDQGKVLSVERTGVSVPAPADDVSYGLSEELFGFPEAWYRWDACFPDPYGEGYLGSYRFQVMQKDERLGRQQTRTLLSVRDCLAFAPVDVDGDGQNELVVRTRWREKPYTVYDWVDGTRTEDWPDTIPPEAEDLLTEWWERQRPW